MRLKANAVFPLLPPAKPPINIVDLAAPCLVPNARTASKEFKALHCLYETVTMGRIKTYETSPTTGKLPDINIDAEDIQGLREGRTRFGAEE